MMTIDRTAEEVRVGIDRVVEALRSEISHESQGDMIAVGDGHVVELLELGHLEAVVISKLIKVSTSGRNIGLVTVVRAGNTLRRSEEWGQARKAFRRTTDGP